VGTKEQGGKSYVKAIKKKGIIAAAGAYHADNADAWRYHNPKGVCGGIRAVR
jgi:hypothetical protein